MLAPLRPYTPVLVLERQSIRRNNITAIDAPNGLERTGLVGGNGERKMPGEVSKNSEGTVNNAGQDKPRSTFRALSESQASPARQTTYTSSAQATPFATSVTDGGVRLEMEALPGQNQNMPDLDDSQLETPALPGVNQDTSNMSEYPRPLSPAEAATSASPPSAPAITVNRPLPGQNQANPIMGEAPLPAPSPSAPASPLSQAPPPLAGSPAPAASSSSEILLSSVQAATTSTQLPIATTSNLFTLSSITSFVTITRSEAEKEGLQATLAVSRTSSASAPSVTVTPTSSATLQAIAVAQSFSGLLYSTATITVATLTPPAAASTQNESILHPTTRTMLILFVIFGILSIIVAVTIFVMIRSHRERSRAQKHALTNHRQYDASKDRTGVSTHIPSEPTENPFLTASEKAIINRAASPNGASDASISSSISDAISSFVQKSRSAAYKISP